MIGQYTYMICLMSIIGLFPTKYCTANEVTIISANFQQINNSHWAVSVTLKHDDSGWDHYADEWRVIDEHGNILGNRILHHPHVNEQPFTRGLSTINIPRETSVVFIEAHDKVDGWTKKRLTIDLTKTENVQLNVKAN